LVCLLLSLPVFAAADAPQFDCDFPGGNFILDKAEGDDVSFHQDLRETDGDWFYWYFRVRNAGGRTLTFHLTKGNHIGARGPAVSDDGGKTFRWLGLSAVKDGTFSYTFAADAADVRFSVAMPYQETNWKAFLQKIGNRPELKAEVLCKSPKGRDVEMLHVGKLDGGAKHRVAITCRHHACEMMASFELEGILEGVLADDETGKWLRENVEFLILPFMDKDGVEDGLQGKNRKPHDPNRDYMGESIYPSVAAVKKLVPEWSGGKLRILLDLHCPYLKGGANENIHLVGGPNPAIWERAQRFGEILQRVQRGPLVYRTQDNVAHGQTWNTLKEPRSVGIWAAELPGISFATSLEFPYANVRDKDVTPETARAFGHDVAAAFAEYLKQ
jgi:hypothetical protein